MEISTCGECRRWRVSLDLVDGGHCYANPKVEQRQRSDPACIHGAGFGSTHQQKKKEIEKLIEGKQDG